MKKIYLNCIYRNNFGDDLLIKTLCDRYNKYHFIILNYEKGNKKLPCQNLTIYNINNILFRLLRKFSKVVLKKRNILESFFINKCYAVITIGGSIFMEDKNWNINKDYNKYFYDKLRIPYFIIGANIGPFYNIEYIEFLKKYVFSNAKDICLRDSKSYEYISELENVRLTTDLIFANKYKIENKVQKKIFISVINIKCKKNQLKFVNENNYEILLNDMIRYFTLKGYTITLASFCKMEGDLDFIQYFIEKYHLKNINILNYQGNLELILNEISESQIIIGTRFHANIIGMIMKKIVIPISYNDKTINILHDLNFKGLFYNLENNNKFAPTDINYSYRCNISPASKLALKSFLEIDKYLK